VIVPGRDTDRRRRSPSSGVPPTFVSVGFHSGYVSNDVTADHTRDGGAGTDVRVDISHAVAPDTT
jgi:hypothetical protein